MIGAKQSVLLALGVALSGVVAAERPINPVVDADGVPVVRGAESLGTVVPEVFRVNLAELPPVPAWHPGDALLEIPRQHWDAMPKEPPVPVNAASPDDPLVPLQFDFVTRRGGGFTTPLINVAGSSAQVSPPDPTGDVGTLHFVQAVNSSGGSDIRIYRKTDGTLVRNFALTSLGGTGACASGLGDPIILFDELASRWVFTEFSSQAGRSLCVYVSDTADLEAATVTWYRYTFTMPAFPDYPKYGVWHDAYYVGANEGGTSGSRPVYAFDRTKMLAGQPATFQRLPIPNLAGFNFQMTTPADHDGSTAPPANARGIFMRHRDDESHNAGSNNPTQDFLEVYQLLVDFTTPANTALTGPVSIPVAEFSSNLNGLTAFNAFPQPNGQKLDPLREPVMNRLAYRNFGSHEALIGNFVTDIDGNDTGGIRWFELRRTGGIAQPWVLHQEGTWAGSTSPQDGIDRWMGGIAMDESGNIALAYSTVRQSPAVFPGLSYVGRLAGDPLGTMTTPETVLVAGTGSNGNERWGDYHQLGVDPVDGCTFWFTGMYMPTTSKGTRIGAFKFDECGLPTFTLAAADLTQQVCTANGAVNLDPITIDVGTVQGFAGAVNLSFANALPTGFSGGFTPSTVNPLPGTSTLAMAVSTAAAPGTATITLDATSGAITKTLNLVTDVATITPAVPTPTAPANGATGASATPTLTWTNGAQVGTNVVEVATDAAFTTIVYTQNVAGGGTSATVSPALASNTLHYWRVRAANTCGTSANSAVFTFKTAPAPGDCSETQSTRAVFEDGVEGDVTGWTTSVGSGTANWTVSTARPYAGTKSWLASDVTVASDQRLTSPAIALPAGESPLTLSFFSDLNLEPRTGGGCWDGGMLQISTDNGTTWTQVPNAAMLTDPYTGAAGSGNPASGSQLWCGTRAYKKAVVDLNSYAGQNVRFRFRTTTDGSEGFAPHGWYVDQVKVQSCAVPLPDAIFANGFDPTP